MIENLRLDGEPMECRERVQDREDVFCSHAPAPAPSTNQYGGEVKRYTNVKEKEKLPFKAPSISQASTQPPRELSSFSRTNERVMLGEKARARKERSRGGKREDRDWRVVWEVTGKRNSVSLGWGGK
jgi:hypothetical protein